ncbi:MAG: hypothetical protein ACRDX8_06455 [Acidimicrobiales bacterium]
MTSISDDRLVAGLLEEFPEMWPRWIALTEDLGENFGAPLVLEELADYLVPLLADPSAHSEVLQRGFHAVEVIARDGDEGATAVAYGFLDGLPPDSLPGALGWIGPCTTGILEALEDGTFDPDSELA